jgi:hypothetical protein
MTTPSFKVVATIQAAVLFAAFFIWWAVNASAYIAGPHVDLYSGHWDFQVMVGVVYLLGFSVAVATLLILEQSILLMFKRRASKKRGSANEP